MSPILRSTIALLLVLFHAAPAAADIVCPDSSYVEVVFNRTYPLESQFAGLPYDYVTITPTGAGETFSNVNGIDEGDGLADIEIRVYVRNCAGEPIGGLAADQIQLTSDVLCICAGGASSDSGSDANGVATFSGTLNAGGCAASLDVSIDGIVIGTLVDAGGRTIKTNSPDAIGVADCFVDASDLARFASVFMRLVPGTNPAGQPLACTDLNELGETINASDLAGFASYLGGACQLSSR